MFKKLACLMAAAVAMIIVPTAFAAVEINTADQAQLDSVAGIGPATSRAILDERKKNGNYKDWADLEQRVRGIGERNSVKLSAAGLMVNGQQRSIDAASKKSAHPVTLAKSAKDMNSPGKEDKDTHHASDSVKESQTKR